MSLPHNFNESMRDAQMAKAANRSALTASRSDPAFAEILAMKTLRPDELKMFEKTNVIDSEDGMRYVKECVYDVAKKEKKQVEAIVTQRIENLERVHEMQLHDYKFTMGSVGELIMVVVLKRVSNA